LSQPYLYTLVVVLKDQSGRVLDCESSQVGFKNVSKAHKQLLVNGHPVVIRGVNRHEHHPEVGKANIESCMIKVLLVFYTHCKSVSYRRIEPDIKT
jgi:beta-galactosidase